MNTPCAREDDFVIPENQVADWIAAENRPRRVGYPALLDKDVAVERDVEPIGLIAREHIVSGRIGTRLRKSDVCLENWRRISPPVG